MPSTVVDRSQTVERFNTYVAGAREVLSHESVISQLGEELASQIDTLYQTAFLPDVQGRTITIPPSEQETSHVAVLPVQDTQMVFAEKALRNCLAHDKQSTIIMGTEDRYSFTYGVTLEHETIMAALKRPHLAANQEVGTYALTIWSSSGEDLGEGDVEYSVSRPVQLVGDLTFARNQSFAGGVAVHEGVHGLDVLEDGVMMNVLGYLAASELRAYRSGLTVDLVFGHSNEFWQLVEDLRRKCIRDLDFPYRADKELIAELVAINAVSITR